MLLGFHPKGKIRRTLRARTGNGTQCPACVSATVAMYIGWWHLPVRQQLPWVWSQWELRTGISCLSWLFLSLQEPLLCTFDLSCWSFGLEQPASCLILIKGPLFPWSVFYLYLDSPGMISYDGSNQMDLCCVWMCSDHMKYHLWMWGS